MWRNLAKADMFSLLVNYQMFINMDENVFVN